MAFVHSRSKESFINMAAGANEEVQIYYLIVLYLRVFFILSTNPQGFVVNVHFPGHSSCWTWWETATSSLLDWSTVCFLSFFIVGLFEILANYFIDPAVWFFLVSCIIFNFNSISSPRQCVCVSANKISHSLKV